jgi:glycosyltransferase involved in cell wall biosynthesis
VSTSLASPTRTRTPVAPAVRSRLRAGQGAPRLLYLVTEDWYFWSHRLPMARAARDAGFRVGVATRCAAHGRRIRDEGFEVYALPWARRSIAPWSAVYDVAAIAALYARVRPSIVHHVALKPVVYGSLAAACTGAPRVVNALTGLGYAFGSRDRGAAMLGRVARPTLRRLLRRPGSVVVVQNHDDVQRLDDERLADRDAIRLVPGSGVDLERFAALPEPDGAPTIGFVGRMLEDKGVRTLLAAHALLRERGRAIDLVLAGAPDPENPTSISTAELEAAARTPGVHWMHHVDDVRDVWRRAHVAVLPSRHEGLPLALLEAAACGRPIVASDVSGCRAIAKPGINALVVPPDDVPALAAAIDRVFAEPGLRHALAARSRPAVVEAGMDTRAIGAAIVAIYRELLDEEARA